jgi:hypothetical protein
VSNIGYDFNKSSPTSEQVTELTSIVSDRADRLQELAQSVASNADSLVVEHSQNRPLMRPTGRRELPPSIAFDSPISFKYEFQNVGSLPWSGWMIIKLTDQYRNSVSVDYAPPSIPTLPPGDSSMLSRDIIVPKVVYKDGEPRSWGDKTTVKVSIHTRLSP